MTNNDGPGAVALGAADRARVLAEMRATLRLVDTAEDAAVIACAEAALGLAERFCGAIWIARAVSESVAASRCWTRLEAGPVRAITGVTAAGVPLAGEAYAVDIDGDGDGWVRVTGAATRLAMTLTAGVTDDWDGLPQPVRQGVLLLAAHLFTRREEASAPPAAVTALWRPFRRLTLGRMRA